MDNPLYREWKRLYAGAKLDHGMWRWPGDVDARCERMLDDFKLRKKLQHQFAWAVPSPEVIDRLAKLSPIVEIGAGRGYWAALLQEAGATVLCYDIAPPDQVDDNRWAPSSSEHGVLDTRVFTEIRKGGPEKVLEHQDHTLFLCWPPYQNLMAHDCLHQYKGDTVVYIGEDDGCTADESFHKFLSEDFEQVEDITIPFWDGLHDHLGIYIRKQR